MTEEIIIDVSGCSHKRDDECMEVPICNEYGDLMGYQSCEAQTLCPYRSQKKIERLEQEKFALTQESQQKSQTICELEQENEKYHKVLEEIRTYLNILSSIDNDFPNTETYLRIQDKINEVLQ